MNEYVSLLADALRELRSAGEELAKPTKPNAPWPRPRIFRITSKFTYPYITTDGGKVYWDSLMVEGYAVSWTYKDTASAICSNVGWKPRAILRALRRIQAATAWCRARAEGRRRAAQEILRQQRKAVEALDAEIAVRELGR